MTRKVSITVSVSVVFPRGIPSAFDWDGVRPLLDLEDHAEREARARLDASIRAAFPGTEPSLHAVAAATHEVIDGQRMLPLSDFIDRLPFSAVEATRRKHWSQLVEEGAVPAAVAVDLEGSTRECWPEDLVDGMAACTRPLDGLGRAARRETERRRVAAARIAAKAMGHDYDAVRRQRRGQSAHPLT